MNATMKPIGLAVAAAVLVVGSAGQARAGMVLESATLGPPGQLGGYILSSGQFMGARFTLDATYRIDQVGGHLGGSGSLFAAIISLAGPTSLPNFAPIAIEANALAATTFAAPWPPEDLLTPLDVTLGPGSYALVIGSGYFGAVGSGYMTTNNSPTAQSSIFRGPTYTWLDSADGIRFVVTGDPVTASAVPEPSTLAGGLLGVAMAGGGYWLRRRKVS